MHFLDISIFNKVIIEHLGGYSSFHYTQKQKYSTQNFTILKIAHNSCLKNKSLHTLATEHLSATLL